MNLKVLVENYIRLRDTKNAIRTKAEEEIGKVEAVMEKIEARLLQHMDSEGAESIKTEAGTCYKSSRTYTSVADWDQVVTFAKEKDLFDIFERRVSKTFCEQYKAVHHDIPPGVNWREEVTVNIRRK